MIQSKSKWFAPILSTFILGQPAAAEQKQIQQEKKNVLFIIVDDLRPELNCYGASYMHTPCIDSLAAQGVLFNNAYANIPVSGASRASFLTGLRPKLKRWWDVHASVDKEAPEAITLPKLFKEQGYVTISNSKVMHGKHDARDSWTKIWKPKGPSKTWRDYLDQDNLSVEKQKRGPSSYECLDVDDNSYFDGKTASKTIKDLRRFKRTGQPFFLAVGILKPHLPFNAPKKYWDLYDEKNMDVPSTFDFDASTLPTQAFHRWNELRYYNNIPAKDDVERKEAIHLIHAYRACVSYADAQVGRIMHELKRLELDENTIVVLIGDHGWSLGEHNQWCKHSNFHVVNSAPMIFSIPGAPRNKCVQKITEFVDLYPTICEAAGLKTPSEVEGESMMSLITGGDEEWKDCAIVKWHYGVTCFTHRYSYTEWRDKKDHLKAAMLFDLKKDPQETVDLSKDKRYASVVKRMQKEIMDRRGKDFLTK